MFGGSDAGIFGIHTEARTTLLLAALPPGLDGVGDLEMLDGRLLATAYTGGTSPIDPPDVLLEVDATGAGARVVGSIGFTCVWALVALDGRLWGIDCAERLLSIDPATGAGTVVRSVGFMGWGATARR